jgi:hypothetical protein
VSFVSVARNNSETLFFSDTWVEMQDLRNRYDIRLDSDSNRPIDSQVISTEQSPSSQAGISAFCSGGPGIKSRPAEQLS